MKRFIKNIAILLAPFMLLVAIELTLPVDYFCFRAVEALGVCTFTQYLPGPFYPWRVLDREEVGNLAAHTSFAVPHRTHWVTDRYGFRYDESTYSGNQFDVAIVGDSQIQGSGLTQSDMLDVLLSSRCHVHTYPYASYSLNDFLNDPRFKQFPPALVIYSRLESGVLSTPERRPGRFERSGVYNNRQLLEFVIMGDRVTKMAILNRASAIGRYWLKKCFRALHMSAQRQESELSSYAMLSTTGKMLHLTSEVQQPRPSDGEIEHCARILNDYKIELERRGISFIFFPIPNKSSIYYETVPWKNPPDSLARLKMATNRYGIDAVDSLPAFIAAAKSPESDVLLYQTDDTHWSRYGVMLAADLLAPKVKALMGK